MHLNRDDLPFSFNSNGRQKKQCGKKHFSLHQTKQQQIYENETKKIAFVLMIVWNVKP